MYYVTDGLYCLSNQIIWQGSPFISIMQALAVDSDDFVALSTYSSNVVLLEAGKAAATIRVELFYEAFTQVHSFLSWGILYSVIARTMYNNCTEKIECMTE